MLNDIVMSISRRRRPVFIVRDSSIWCPLCRRPYLEFIFGFRNNDVFRDVAAIDENGFLNFPGGTARDYREVRDALRPLSVWTCNAPLALIADPCLLKAAKVSGQPLTMIALLIAHVMQSTGHNRSCFHAIVVDHRLCTTLAYDELDNGTASGVKEHGCVGMLNIADLHFPPVPERFDVPFPIAPSLSPVEADHGRANTDDGAVAPKRWGTQNIDGIGKER